jgi:hypothetical protein
MKRNYVKPEMQVVKINQSANILEGSPVGKVGSNVGLGLGGGSSEGGRSRDYDDWDEE